MCFALRVNVRFRPLYRTGYLRLQPENGVSPLAQPAAADAGLYLRDRYGYHRFYA